MELEKLESSEITLVETEARTISKFFSLAQLMGREESSTSLRFWLRETELSDGWGSGSSSTTRQATIPLSPYAGFESPHKSKLMQQRPCKPHRAGRGIFWCFRHRSLNLTLPELVPSTVLPGIGHAATLCTSGAAHCTVTFMDEASDHQHQSNNSHLLKEPTSPVVNCIGQVRLKKKQRQQATPWSPSSTQ